MSGGDGELAYKVNIGLNIATIIVTIFAAAFGGWIINFIFGVNIPPYIPKCLNL